MPRLLRVAHLIDRASNHIGVLAAWMALLMVLGGAYNSVARYLDRSGNWNLSSNAYLEGQWYLFSGVFLLGASYALRSGAHVRVDVFYGRLSPRGKAWLNVLGALVFTIPFCLFTMWVSWEPVVNSWAIREQSPDPGGLPRYPIKTLILVAFALLTVQAVSEVIKRIAALRGAIAAEEIES